MAIINNSKTYHEKMFPDCKSKLLETDPEHRRRWISLGKECGISGNLVRKKAAISKGFKKKGLC